MPPLEPVNIVGVFCEIRGPSDAIKTSAFASLMIVTTRSGVLCADAT